MHIYSIHIYARVPRFIVHHVTVLHRYWFFYKLKVCHNPASKSVGDIFPTVFAHLVSLCHILVILAIFQTFLLLYLLWWSVIFDVTLVIVLECHKLHPFKMANLIDKMCVFWLLHRLTITPFLSLSSGFPIPWDTTILKLSQLITLQWPFSVKWKEKPHISHFKSKAKHD